MPLPLERIWGRLASAAGVIVFVLWVVSQTWPSPSSGYVVSETFHLHVTNRGFDPGLGSLEDSQVADRLDSAVDPTIMTATDVESYILDLLDLKQRGQDLPLWLRYNVDNFKPRKWKDFDRRVFRFPRVNPTRC